MTIDNTSYKPLTKHAEASLREVWAIALPLIITASSSSIMMFADRLILANYHISAMNAAAIAFTVFAVFQFGTVGITIMSEVFVGQYNGAKQYLRLGEPVWQMIWFALMWTVILIPLAFFFTPVLIPDAYQEWGIPYLKWLLYFGSVFPMVVAISGFFIGQGKVNIILIVNIIANIINIILDYTLVFGIDGLIPSLGTAGAAIATIVSQFIILIALASIFLNKYNRKYHGTMDYRFKLNAFLKCIKVGLPAAVGHMLEIGAWALLFFMMALVSEEHITVFAIGQGMLVLFFFVAEGMNKSVIAIASNYIGAKKPERVYKTFYSAVKLQIVFILILIVPFIIFPNILIDVFFWAKEVPIELPDLKNTLVIVFVWMWVIIGIDGFIWILAGMLIAAGDTKFVMWMNAIAGWFFGVVPFYIYLFIFDGSAQRAWLLAIFYVGLSAFCFYLRFNSGKWKNIKLIN